MGIFAKLFGRKDDDKKVGGMEDYMTLVRVYFQAALASQLGITNLAMLPDSGRHLAQCPEDIVNFYF